MNGKHLGTGEEKNHQVLSAYFVSFTVIPYFPENISKMNSVLNVQDLPSPTPRSSPSS